MILNRISSRSFWMGAFVVTAGTLTWLFLIRSTYGAFTLDGDYQLIEEPFITAHPLFSSLLTILSIGVIGAFDLIYRSQNLRWPSIATTLAALIWPFVVMAFVVNYSHHILPDRDVEPDSQTIHRIQANEFGEHGTFLKNADKVIFYSTDINLYQTIEGEPDPELFHGYKVFGSIEITDPALIEDIHANLQDRIDWNKGLVISVMCYMPRHGFRAYNGKDIRDYHVCFECAKLYIYPDIHTDEPDFITLDTNAAVMGKDPASHFFNEMLDEAGIERDRSNDR